MTNMASIRTEDASDRLHLSLLSSPKDHDNPNTGVYTYNEEALGQGTWIVMINTGYNWEQFPQEFGRPGEDRPLVLWNVPENTRNATLEEHEIADGLHWPPDDSTDYGDPFEGVPEGHGTQTAIVSGGMRTGVARKAGLYLIKAGGAVLDADENVAEEDVCAQSLLISLHHVVEKLRDGTLPPGKTVVIIDTPDGTSCVPTVVWNIEDMRQEGGDREQKYKEWCEKVETALDELDSLGGVMASVAAGNEGGQDPPGETGEFMPNILVRRERSPLVIVGAVTRGKNLLLPDLSVEEDTLQSGTTFAACIVAGQAACMLSDPAFNEKLKWSVQDARGNTVASRLKQIMSEEGNGSFQRVPGQQMLDPASAWRQVNTREVPKSGAGKLTRRVCHRNYPIPERLNVVCNGCAISPTRGRKRKSQD
ncbi:hypothetical protein DHEL01_v207663 [Diaporthe helianthi]|uniref:Peptidase S8/S53 domain-containing protein n=1 Tax=Diaporthe helianthi TaxID=158607 RepID=A0A2P5HUM1_DIAHE|nr:hypothetical protein DHEL01_v207663 [Diaporthe helianthi]